MSFVNIDALCWELYNVMNNNFHGDVTRENFEEKFEEAKNILIEDLEDCIKQNKITMINEFDLNGDKEDEI